MRRLRRQSVRKDEIQLASPNVQARPGPLGAAADQRRSGPVGGGWPTAITGFIDAETNPNQIFRPTDGTTHDVIGSQSFVTTFLPLTCESRSTSNYGLAAET